METEGLQVHAGFGCRVVSRNQMVECACQKMESSPQGLGFRNLGVLVAKWRQWHRKSNSKRMTYDPKP